MEGKGEGGLNIEGSSLQAFSGRKTNKGSTEGSLRTPSRHRSSSCRAPLLSLDSIDPLLRPLADITPHAILASRRNPALS